MEPAGPFTRQLWESIVPVFQQILDCNYIKGLTDGTLPYACFAHYLSQDVLYIIDDSRALAATASRAAHPDEMYFFLQMAKDGLDIERALHNDFIGKLNIPPATTKSPAFKAYTDFLLDNAFHAPYEVSVAALLPCFWVYGKTGEFVLKNAGATNPYRTWIDTYSGGEYKCYTRRFIDITEMLGQRSGLAIGAKMKNAFMTGTQHEWYVFEEAMNYENH